MKNPRDRQYLGTHDYDDETAKRFASYNELKTFSIGIFQWVMTAKRKKMKPSKCIVRVKGTPQNSDAVFKEAERIIALLDAGEWNGKKSVTVK